MEPRLGPLDVVLYAAILCIHYPLRVALATFRLTKATIVKAVSLPRQFLGSAIPLLTAIEQTLEKKIIGILNLLATLPSYIFGKTKSSINLESKQEQIVNDPKEIGEKRKSYLEIILALQAKLSDIVYDSIVTVVTIWGHFILLPLKLILFPLKVGKSVIGTLLNFPAPKDPIMEKNINKSIFERLFDLIYIILREVQFLFDFYNNNDRKTGVPTNRTDSQHSKTFIQRHQAVLYKMYASFSSNPYFYLQFSQIQFILHHLLREYPDTESKKNQPVKEPAVVQSKASTVNASSDKDIQKLIQENSKLKNALVRAQEKNENHKCDQQIKDLEIQLKDVQLAFDKERQQYKRDITKLKQELNQNNTEKISDFNSERTHLQSEIQKLQNLIAEVQKDNEEESRMKKQEAIDLDNERNQLQEQIQTLQLEVVGLQKQSEANALSYSEANKQMERNFEAEREQLHREIQELKNKITEIEDSQNEAKHEYLLLLKEKEIFQDQNQNLQTVLKALHQQCDSVLLLNTQQRQDFTEAWKNFAKESESFKNLNKTRSDLHYQLSLEFENERVHLRNKVEEVKTQLYELLLKYKEDHQANESLNHVVSEKLDNMKTQIRKTHDDIKQMRFCLIKQSEERDKLKLIHSNKIKRLKEESTTVLTLHAQIEILQRCIEDAENTKLKYETVIAETAKKVQFLQQENGTLNEDVSYLQSQIAEKRKDTEGKLKKERILHESIVSKMNQEIQKVQEECVQKVLIFNKKLQEVETGRSKLEQENEELQTEVNTLRTNVEKLKKAKRPFFGSKLK